MRAWRAGATDGGYIEYTHMCIYKSTAYRISFSTTNACASQSCTHQIRQSARLRHSRAWRHIRLRRMRKLRFPACSLHAQRHLRALRIPSIGMVFPALLHNAQKVFAQFSDVPVEDVSVRADVPVEFFSFEDHHAEVVA